MTTIVLLPGMDGTGLLFAPFLRKLVNDIHSIVISYPTEQFLDYPALVAYVRERLPTERPFFLLGESFSGPVAISIAANAPHNLAGLILCASFARNPRPLFATIKSILALLPGLNSPTFATLALLGISSTPELRQQIATALAAVPPRVLRTRLRTVLESDFTDALPDVRVPILYLRATRDRLVPYGAGALIASLAPTQIVDIDAPHMVLQTAPEIAATVVASFVTARKS